MKKILVILLSFMVFAASAQRPVVDEIYIRSGGNVVFDGVPFNPDSVDSKIIEAFDTLGVDQPLDSLSFTDTLPPTYQPWTFKVDTTNGALVAFTAESEVTNQLSQELWLYGQNKTGSTLNNFEIVYVDTCEASPRCFKRAIGSSRWQASRTILIATHDIENNTKGYATKFGDLTGNTSAWSVGDELYLSHLDSGQIINYPPPVGFYPIYIGEVKKVGVTDGLITADVTPWRLSETDIAAEGVFNGIILQKQSISDTIISNTLYMETDNELYPTMDLIYMYQGVFYPLNTTTNTGTDGKARVVLSYGTESNPVTNYVYINHNSGSPVLEANTTAFPEDGVRHSECAVYDQATHEAEGFANFQRFNNSINGSPTDGWLSKSGKNARLAGTRWYSGVLPTVDIVTDLANKDSINVYTAAGVVPQFNYQNFDAQTEKSYYWYNCPSGGKWISDLNEIDSTSDGTTLESNNSRYTISVFGVQKSGAFRDYLVVAVSNSTFATDQGTIDDIGVTSLPTYLRYTGFRIAKLSLRHNTTNNGTITNLSGTGGYRDDRGQPLNTVGTGTIGGEGATYPVSDATLSISSNADPTKLATVSLDSVTPGTTSTQQWPATSGSLAKTTDIADTIDNRISGAVNQVALFNSLNSVISIPITWDGTYLTFTESSNTLSFWSGGGSGNYQTVLEPGRIEGGGAGIDIIAPDIFGSINISGGSNESYASFNNEGITFTAATQSIRFVSGGSSYFYSNGIFRSLTDTLADRAYARSVGGSGGGAMTAEAINDSIATLDTVFIDSLKTNAIILGLDTITEFKNNCFIIAISDSLTELTTANGDSWKWPYNCTIDSVVIAVNSPPTGSTLTVEIKKNGTSIFSTPITIDSGEETSVTAATDYVLSTTTIDFLDDMQAYMSSVGATYGGSGMKVYIYYTKD